MASSNVDEFVLNVNRFSEEEVPKAVQEATKRIAADGYSGVIDKTPVDTGFLVNSWSINVGNISLGAAGAPSSRDVSLSEGEAQQLRQDQKNSGDVALSAVQPFQLVTIANGAEYAPFIENGSSQNAPQGMVAPTIAELRSKYRRIS